MAEIKEFREFFLRSTAVNTGAKKDQELGFPTDYIVNGASVKNRFLINHFPNEAVMKKFLESLTFKLNVEDTATETQQGLSKQATQAQFDAGTNNDATDNFALHAKPSHIKDKFTLEVGDRQYTEENYVTNDEALTLSVDKLDQQVDDNETNIANNAAFLVPTGGIIMWSGTIGAIPAGWLLCDGSLGTPNLAAKFVVGYDATPGDYNTIGNTGGEEEHALTVFENAQHSHRVFESTAGGGANQALSGGNIVANSSATAGLDFVTEESGAGNPHENRPPYFVIAYIMKS